MTIKNTKYIFVTGGVVSGLGKGITAASVGLILKSAGYSVDLIKFDPYLNVDPGTMSPIEHGEVYILEDGSETDLDLGHYERFLDINLTSNSSVTAGKIYSSILEMERTGVFLGKNVQLIPNVTNYIKECFVRSNEAIDVRIIEIGGSAGDMEGEIFLEAIRQFRREKRGDVLHIHLGYVPFLACSQEYKTKPFQNSLRELLRCGLQPHVLVARYEKQPNADIEIEQLAKIALFGNIAPEYVLPVPDLKSIYEAPNHLIKVGAVPLLAEFMQSDIYPALPAFFLQDGVNQTTGKSVKVGVVGKYGSKLGDADYSVMQSLAIAGFYAGCEVIPEIILADDLVDPISPTWDRLKSCDAVMVLGGFGRRGMEGKIKAIEYARTTKKPFLGICLGLQLAVVEFARSVCGIDAISAEMLEEGQPAKPSTSKVIDYMPGQSEYAPKGGTMRLGGYQCELTEGSIIRGLYGVSSVIERHRHRLEVQNQYIDILASHGMQVTGKHYYEGKTGPKYLSEMIELDRKLHPYFVATQSHPEVLSRPTKAHPLFLGLVTEALAKITAR